MSRDLSAREPLRSVRLSAARDAGLVVLGYIPFGLAAGAAMASTGVDPVLAFLSSPLIFAGAAQLAAVQLLGMGTGIALVVATVAIINARHLLYSAALAPHLAEWTPLQRFAAAYLLADPVYALAAARFDGEGGGGDADRKRAYYFTAGLTCLVGWTALVTIGLAVGGLIPVWVPLELAIPLTFLLLALPLIRDMPGLVAATVGGVAALAAHDLPFGVGILVGAAAGIAAGVVAMNVKDRRDA
ncbi:putative branched-subunit amino acid permease [Microbacteriaceae bacterium SG_E_30_P1]|uniref:Branched-subunit amino acid permease n=1 Tax=Antiquaquibacter oligotrophicus TaxID=2880260 RepID=A0ABT6KLZ8_9MICO|nr:AzlC family ABC transporter permease [Antiquaquibacter oligotrophicus]MDH6181041.1 putative branched-subunit amino acid permease [Antiquaquibacter oligotrophicus]UDF13261.1 AzlC family ABC transporter permease [Antiquaquibacter oligotrophicus]